MTSDEQRVVTTKDHYSYRFRCSNCYDVRVHKIPRGTSVHKFSATEIRDVECANCGCSGYIQDSHGEFHQ